MHAERLLKLADLLEADAKNERGVKFDLSTWGYVIDADGTEKPTSIKVDCGTSACAIGLACISGAFKADGLTYRILPKARAGGNNIEPRCGKLRDFEAVTYFFDITTSEAFRLFLDSSYDEWRGSKGELKVAKRIRDFVAGKVMLEPLP